MMKKANVWVPLITMMAMASCSNADGSYQEKYHKLVLEYNRVVYQKNELYKKNREYTADIVQLEGELDTLKRTIRNKSKYAQINKLYDDEKAKNKKLNEEVLLLETEANVLYQNLYSLIKFVVPKIPNFTIKLGDDDNVTVNGVKLVK